MKLSKVFASLALLCHMVKCYDNSDNSYIDSINASWKPNDKVQEDELIIKLFRRSFAQLEQNDNLSGCDKCKTRLALGKILSLNQPYLVPTVFMEWCMRKGNNEVDCRIKFNNKELNHKDTFSSDFTNILQLMSPYDLDGDLFCFHHDDECDVKPDLPDVDQLMGSWYPKKPFDKMFPLTSHGLDTFHILQLSDFDYQIDYLIGLESNCSQEVCCIHCGFNENKLSRELNLAGHLSDAKYQLSFYNSSYDEENNFNRGPYIDVSLPTFRGTWDPAHEFGSYRCGSPELLINNTLKTVSEFHMRKNIDFEFQYVLFNGGLQVRSNNFEETVNSEMKMLKFMKHFFGSTPVISALGKHDTYPDSQLLPYSAGKSWEFSWNEELYGDTLLENGWVDNNQFRSIKTHNGAYSIVTEYGLKIISLNSNFYNSDNYYTFWNVSNIDNFGQFKFLIDELIESENCNQRVWLMSSLSLQSDKALLFQLKILESIIKRFSPATIAEIFFGDSHRDSYHVMYDSKDGGDPKPIAGAWVAPSVSALHGNNPGFRYYEIDSKTFSVVNAYTYYTPLEKTYLNNGDEPQWSLLYSTRDSYTRELPADFWPEELPLNATFWDSVLKKRIRDNISYKQLYQNNKYKLSQFTPNCSDEHWYATCELSYCEILSFTYDEYKTCIYELFPALYDQAFF